MNKKILSVILCVTMVSTLLVACGYDSNSSSVTNAAPAVEEEKTEGEVENTSVNAEYIFKFSHQAPAVGVQNTGCQYFCDLVEEYSGGRIKMENYPAAQLAEKTATLEGLQMGTIEVTEVAATDLTVYDDLWDVWALPYLFKNGTQSVCVQQDETVRAITDQSAEDMGFIILSWLNYSERNIANTKKPIEMPSDLKGLKIRVMQSAALVNAMTALGAATITLPWTECYSAVQQGTLDAVENSTPLITSNGFNEICPYYSLTKHFIVADPVMISKKVYESLPKELQEVIIKAGKEYEEYWNSTLWPAAEEEEMQKLLESGVEINEPDLTPFMDIADRSNETTIANFNDHQKELYDTIISVKDKY